MNRRPIDAGGTWLVLMFCATLFGCNDDRVSFSSPGAGPVSPGVVDTVPEIDGAWLARSMVTGNTCGALAGVPPDDRILQIEQVDTAIRIDALTSCGEAPIEATGSLTPSNVLTTTSSRTLDVAQDCTLLLVEDLTGIADNLGDHLEGSVIVEVTPVDTPTTDCGGGFPCTIEVAFQAERCPPADCTLAACGTATTP